jgi:hypothetical protein
VRLFIDAMADWLNKSSTRWNGPKFFGLRDRRSKGSALKTPNRQRANGDNIVNVRGARQGKRSGK